MKYNHQEYINLHNKPKDKSYFRNENGKILMYDSSNNTLIHQDMKIEELLSLDGLVKWEKQIGDLVIARDDLRMIIGSIESLIEYPDIPNEKSDAIISGIIFEECEPFMGLTPSFL